MRLLSNERATPTSRIVRVALDGVGYSYRAGQAAAVGVNAGDGRLTPYSIASAPHETAEQGYLEFLVKVDGSNRFGAIVTDLQPGTRLFVSPASGRFALPEDEARRSLLFIAGGTGIAPMRSMIRETMHRDPQQRPALIYSARTPDEFAYLEEFRAMADAGKIALTLTLTGHATEWLHARGRAGAEHVNGLITPDTLSFLCGPPAMVTDLYRELESLGLPADRIKTENW